MKDWFDEDGMAPVPRASQQLRGGRGRTEPQQGSHGRGVAPGTGMDTTFPREFQCCVYLENTFSLLLWVPAARGGAGYPQMPPILAGDCSDSVLDE